MTAIEKIYNPKKTSTNGLIYTYIITTESTYTILFRRASLV